MTDELLQCCYTNAAKEIDGKISSGGQTVSVSRNIPPEALATCAKFQNANSTIQSTKTDENGEVLNLLEIVGDGSYVYMIRTKYGLLDRLGRANMFSHAFILPCRDARMISDPNSFLTIANENFRYSEDEADRPYDGILRLNEFDLEKALAYCHLTDDLFRTLIQCVYVQYSDRKLATPLFIQYDGSEEHLRNLLFCIYTGLPLSIRRTLSVSSSETDGATGKNIIFTKNAMSRELFLVASTGENNVLSQRSIRKVSRLGFVEYVVRNHRTLDEIDYFRKLEEQAIELGDPTASNELILKIAHGILVDPDAISDDDELQARLSDALRSKSVGNRTMDDYIATMLNAAVERKLCLTDESEASLRIRLNAQPSELLGEAAERYTFYRFSSLSEEDAAGILAKMGIDEFQDYKLRLSQTDAGIGILDCYYEGLIAKVTNGDWDTLNKILRDTDGLRGLNRMEQRAGTLANNFYENAVCQDKERGFDNINTIFDSYLNIVRYIATDDTLEKAASIAKEYFWKQMDFYSFSFYSAEKYSCMECPRSGRMFVVYSVIPALLQRAPSQKNPDDREFFENACGFFIKASATVREKELNEARRKLAREAVRARPEADRQFESWCRLFFSLPTTAQFDQIFDIYRACKHKELLKVQENYARFTQNSIVDASNTTKALSNLLVDWLRGEDSSEAPVALDTWLVLSANVYGNAFTILDRCQPMIINIEPARVASSSRLLGKAKYRMDADTYIRNKGENARTVKKWMTEHGRAYPSQGKRLSVGKPIGGRTESLLESRKSPVVSDSVQEVKTASDKTDSDEKKGLFGKLFGRK